MTRRAGLFLFLAAALLFLIANRGAYKGYFQDDELDNISWAPDVPAGTFARGLATPVFNRDNFRPAGHAFFALFGKRFGLNFPPYAAGIHAIHLLNVWLLWLLARRLGADWFGASAAALFLAFHMALFDAYWKPMYVFDLLCATFTLLCLLFYIERRWVLSFAAFWLAYKSKELAVMLPAVLACYEYWLGKRRWKPLVPFFAVSLSFGLQAMFVNRGFNDDYTFRFSLAALRRTVPYYAGRIFLVPYAGLALFAVPAFTRDRRAWFGVAAMALWFVPLLFLPGRLFSPYCYVPLIGAAIAISALAHPRHRVLAAAFFAVWIPWNEYHLRLERRKKLALDDEIRSYVTTLATFARSHPNATVFVYDGAPAGFNRWGIEAVLRISYHRIGMRLIDAREPGAPVLHWDAARRTLTITEPS